MDLADFLAAKLAQSNYRDMEALTRVSRGSLEALIKRQTTSPDIETLTRIAKAYGKPLWEVMQMAGVNLGLPQTATEAAQRLDTLAQQVPGLSGVVKRLKEEYDVRPDYVKGMVLALEASLGPSSNGPAQP
jgi:transcriptional regulator with XRE-family HTH domain